MRVKIFEYEEKYLSARVKIFDYERKILPGLVEEVGRHDPRLQEGERVLQRATTSVHTAVHLAGQIIRLLSK